MIDLGVSLQMVENTTKPPGPCSDGAPLIRGWLGLAGPIEQRVDPVGVAIVIVRIKIATVGRDEGVSPIDDPLERPA